MPFFYKINKILRKKKRQNKCSKRFSEKTGTLESPSAENRVQSYWHIFTSIVMPQALIHFHQNIRLKNVLECFAPLSRLLRTALSGGRGYFKPKKSSNSETW